MLNKFKIIALITLAFAIVFFVCGMCFPLLSTETVLFKLRLQYEEITVFKSIKIFWELDELFLAIIISLFSFLTPVVEFVAIAVRILRGKTNKFFQQLDKWNMLDVFLVAILLLNYEMNSKIIVMKLGYGALYIALSVIFRIVTIMLLDIENKPRIQTN
ncbi:MAG: paraquat-inducible protein A [Paludibacteraceae bacterium]|nr:paraquat-inducible protein A [Paludibacteraceae bacterium]